MAVPATLAPALPRPCPTAPIRLSVVAALWGLPVLLTLASAPAAAILAATALAALACATANVARPASIVVTLPFFALLSPVTGLLDLGAARLVFSDLLFALLAVQAGLMLVARPGRAQPRLPPGLTVLAMLFALGVITGSAVGYLVSAKPWLYLAQLAIVAWFTAAHATHHEDWLSVQRAWIVASVYGATVLLQAYGEGRSLDTLKDGDALPAVAPDDLLSLFRATYYYTGFHYIMGLCVVWVGTRLFFPASRRHRLALLAALALLVPALVATVNKTAIAAVAVAVTLTGLALFARFRREMAAAMAWFAALGAGALAVASWQYGQLAENTQIDLIVDRLFNASSLLIRLEVYVQALTVWSASPWTVLLGYGADFLDSSGNPLFADPLKTSAMTGHVEGTLDSAWLSYLVEFGLPGMLLLAGLFASGLANALRGVRRSPRFDERAFAEASLFGGLVFLAIAMTTQMLGYSKTSWLPLQLVVVAAIGLRARRAG
jgi:uncharacterized membrane protein